MLNTSFYKNVTNINMTWYNLLDINFLNLSKVNYLILIISLDKSMAFLLQSLNHLKDILLKCLVHLNKDGSIIKHFKIMTFWDMKNSKS